MDNIRKIIDLLANIAIVVVAILLSIVLVKNYLSRSPALKNENNVQMSSTEARSGEKINLADIDWQRNGKTLLLALSTTCHFCTESAPFYQRLVKENSSARLVALVPQTSGEGQSYLKKLGVKIDDVKQVALGDLGISGTPTLILVDGSGKIENTWIGLLSADKERDLLSHLQPERASR